MAHHRGLEAAAKVCCIRGGDAGAPIESMPLLGKKLLERSEKQQHVRRARAVAHQADAPDLSLEGAQAAADLNPKSLQQTAANFKVIHAGGNLHGVEHGELMSL